MWRASNMFNVIAFHKLLELTRTIGQTIVSLQPVGKSMCWEVLLQGSDHFIASLVLKLVDFKVAGIIIYCAEVVPVFKMEDIASNCFPRTAWDFVRDKCFLLLIFLVRSTQITLGYVVVKVSIHARPVDCGTCMLQAAFNSCVGTMKLFTYFGPQGKRYYTS